MNEKANKINELESINDDLKIEMNKLKEIFNAESDSNKETKQKYDLIKNNYADIKNQYDLLNMKYQTLSDENYNYKRDKLLYEKELNSKNQMIQDLMGNSSTLKKMELQNKLNQYENITNNLKKDDYFQQINYISKNNNNFLIKEETEAENAENAENREKSENFEKNHKKVQNEEEIENNNEEEMFSKYEGLDKEELKKIRDKLLVERSNTNNLYNKIPRKIKKIEQIRKRDELEKKLAQINNELMQIRLRLKANT